MQNVGILNIAVQNVIEREYKCRQKQKREELRRTERHERVTRTEIATERNVLPTPGVKRGNGLVF